MYFDICIYDHIRYSRDKTWLAVQFSVKEIQLRHRSPVTSLAIVDRAMHLVSRHGQPQDSNTADAPVSHQAIVSSEEQIKVRSIQQRIHIYKSALFLN